MKKSSVTFGVTLTVSLIVISLLVPVNHSVCQISPNNAILVADGSPLPPVPPPPPPGSTKLKLDGSPLPPTPPPPPQKLDTNWLPADGLLVWLITKS
jgi:hypothetical protein